MFTAWLLPNLGAISAGVASYVALPTGWHTLSVGSNALRYLVPVVLLTPVTALMGATLTLLIRFVVSNEIQQAGLRIGLLYGFNTAGAALGCLATDLLLIPRLGLLATQCAATLGNFVAALAALLLARSLLPSAGTTEPSDAAPLSAAPTQSSDAAPDSPARAARVLFAACLAVLLAGAVGMGMEIVWFRYLISLLGAYREVFSLLLGMILIGIWGGSTLAGLLERRYGRPALLFAVAQCSLVVTCAVPLMLLTRGGLSNWMHASWQHFSSAPFWTRSLAEVALAELIPIALVTAVPACMMGMSFPLANAVVQQQSSHVGRRAGLLYASNTTGAVLGALLSGFWLLPQAGTQLSVLVWLSCSLLAVLPLALLDTSRSARITFTTTAVLATFVLIAWIRLPSNWLVDQTIPPDAKGEQILAASEGVGETIVIAKSPRGTRLITNGHDMSATSILGQRYMRLFSHLPLLQAPQASDALVICYGVGNTLNATLLHPQLQRVHLVDISAHVLQHAHHFEDVNG
ncbi:MAG TPA: hypothetical protein VHO25_04195, partial [Polyangiaceae bacterium]|nr:hypothetical protein [Polyangiaceae bacterium]